MPLFIDGANHLNRSDLEASLAICRHRKMIFSRLGSESRHSTTPRPQYFSSEERYTLRSLSRLFDKCCRPPLCGEHPISCQAIIGAMHGCAETQSSGSCCHLGRWSWHACKPVRPKTLQTGSPTLRPRSTLQGQLAVESSGKTFFTFFFLIEFLRNGRSTWTKRGSLHAVANFE